MNLRSLFPLALTLIVATPALGQEKPLLPYIDQGACPFECCTYREWKANENVVAYIKPKEGAATAFTIQKAQWVTAETGFLVTWKAGVTKVIKPITLGYAEDNEDPNPKPALSLNPGELLYTLHYAGEGYDLYWYKGQLYSDQISSDKSDSDPPPPELSLQVLSRPVVSWWVKIKTKGGLTGWIVDPPYFENSDACG